MRTQKFRVLTLAATASLVLAACSGNAGAPTGSSVPTGGTPAPGGTAVFALPASSAPDWIWPFADPVHSSNLNLLQFQQLMYRPLYVFGDGQSPAVSDKKGLANAPQYAPDGKSVTITLKPYKWSDGSAVTTTDVMFWLNMIKAKKAQWSQYSRGSLPDNVTSVKVDSPTTMTLTLDHQYSPEWFTATQLTLITPMPRAWDRTASGPSDCAHDVAKCPAVYDYLYGQAKDVDSYAKSRLWSVVNGPWKLSEFNADGHIAMVPNTAYSGPDKPKLAKLQYAPFTTDGAEYNVLRAGGNAVHVGYIPAQNITSPTKDPTVAGPNPVAANYYMVPWIQYRINFFEWNFNNPVAGPIFRQLYFRQAFQHLVNQQAIIDGPMKGYGYPTTGPVPALPKSDLMSDKGKQNPYPFSVEKATALLEQNGWTVKTDGASFCARPGTGPGQCGEGIQAGQKLEFNLNYISGSSVLDQAMAALKSDESKAGIVLNLSGGTHSAVLGALVPCKPADSACSWQMLNWGSGYGFLGYPTGEHLFLSGAGGNKNGYSDKITDTNIEKTIREGGVSVLHTYADYVAEQLPVVWQPNQVSQLTAVANNLRGVAPQSVGGGIYPEDWYFVS
ncbi:ABC transporter substrate-binding protein [Amycolatopsis jejuensis]|uniref:ABC transporter substrate-binding protein n=1 Tax=Amycolatopsis jejuensis TaxID=330084 RepID=UPI000524D03E|nr:ABC transporter substrate-binding protein [Amycolatopsis jejuensis]